MFRAVLLCAVSSVLVSAVAADEVRLRDGRVLVGSTRVQGDDLVITTLEGKVRVPRDEVVRIRTDDQLRFELEALAARTGEAPFARVELARTARDWGLYEEMWALLDDVVGNVDGAAEARLRDLLGDLEPVVLPRRWHRSPPSIRVRELLRRVHGGPAHAAAVEEVLVNLVDADDALRLRARAAGREDERAVAVAALARREAEGNDRFVWRTTVLDRHPSVRQAAVDAIADDATAEAVDYLAAGLLHDSPAVRVRTAEAYARLDDPAAIDVLVDAGPMAGTPRRADELGGSIRAHMAITSQQAYIRDFDVEVAQASFIADPKVDVLQSGTVLDVTVHAVTTHRTVIVDAWRRALHALAGSDPGPDPASWAEWRAGLGARQGG